MLTKEFYWHSFVCAIACLAVFTLTTTPAASQQKPADVANLRSIVTESPDRQTRLTALWNIADVYRNQGKLREALLVIDDARNESQSESELTITALRRAGIALGLGLTTEAEGLLLYARNQQSLLDPATQIVLLLEEGNLAVESETLELAVQRFEQAAVDAASLGEPALEARARINALRANLDNFNLRGIESRLDEIDSLVGALVPGDEKALLALAVGDMYRLAVTEYFSDRTLLGSAYRNYDLARSVAESAALRAYAYGFLGALYEDDGRLNEALRFSTQALFYAQEAGQPEQHYRWEWQVGRILRAQDRFDEAQSAYERAVVILNQVRSNFVLGSRDTFDTLVGPVYTEYADILMLQAAAMPLDDLEQLNQQQSVLRQVRNQLEALKRSEIEDYFANQCAIDTDLDQGPGATEDTKVAVIYPLLLDNRIEVVVEAAGDIRQFSVPVNRGQATRVIRAFRLALEDNNSDDYLAPAKTLYEWLITPSLPLLDLYAIETLMIVPGGALRTVPFSALHDGTSFLIEQFAVATTPAIGLTDTRLADTETVARSDLQNLLIGGLTEAVQGFNPLPNVGLEIDRVSAIMPGGIPMLDTTFQLQAVETELANNNFSVAHFATHGQFSGDYKQSFILTYDSQLTLDGLREILEKRGDDPLDLLVLSACETAAGDDRAALGLAGVAVQSGAKSVIASLWKIDDRATTELISEFYGNLSPNSTKATSLQQAQLSLLKLESNSQWSHPAYWAPFLLIGSWQ